MSNSKATLSAPLTLELSFDQKSFGDNRAAYHAFMKRASAELAKLEHFKYVADFLNKRAGTKFAKNPPPKLSAEITEDLLPDFKKSYVKYCIDVKDQLERLYVFIWECLGPNTRARLEANALVLTNDLKVTDGSKIHDLLLALFTVCITQVGVEDQVAKIAALRNLVNVKQGDESFATYIVNTKSKQDSVVDLGYNISEAEVVYAILDGANSTLAPHRSAILSAASASAKGLPTTISELNTVIQKVDANFVNGGGVSAFAVQVDKGSKRRIEERPAQKDDRAFEACKNEKEKLKKQVAAKDKIIAELREENRKLKGKADEADVRGRRDRDNGQGRDRSPPPRDDRRGGKKVKFEGRVGNDGKDSQRRFPPGHGGKNQPTGKTPTKAIKAMSSRSGHATDVDSSFDSCRSDDTDYFDDE